ncbi:hypothetical protein JCM11641_003709 [Rhodosporidiobolus odoratus]
MPPPQTANGPSARQSILPLFPLLSSHQLATRLDASLQLLQALPLSAPSTSTDPDTPYALKRLLAGLASSNEAARQGFAVALSQLVAVLPDDRANAVLPQLFEQTTSKAGMDSREERDLLFARLMGLHALVRSGVLVRSSAQEGGQWQETVQALVGLGNKKTWIREPAYWVVCEALKALLESEASWKDESTTWAVQRLVNDAREKAKGWGPEKVAIVLTLQSYGVDADWSSALAPTFTSASVLSRSSLPALATALKGSAAASSSEPASGPKQGSNATKTSKGAAAPAPGQAPHFVWTLLRDAFFPSVGAAQTEISDKAKFADFWRICVDQNLFASPSLPLKSLGFSLITLFLTSLPASDLVSLFNTPHTLRVFANHLRSGAGAAGEKTLSRVADKLASSTLPAYFSSEPAAALPLLKVLTGGSHSSHNAFEVKFLEKIVARLPLSGVKGWISYLQTMILTPEQEEGSEILDQAEKDKRLTAQRTWALDQLLHVARNGGVQKDEEAMRGVLEFLAVVGWFEVVKEGSKGARSYVATPALTSSQRLAAKSRFFSVLTALVSAPSTTPAPSSSSAACPTLVGGTAWLSRAVGLLDTLAGDDKAFARAHATEADDEDDEEAKALEERIKSLYSSLAAPPANAAADEKDGKKKKGRQSAGGAPAAAAAAAEDVKSLERKSVARSLCEGVRLVAWDEGAQDAQDVLESTVDAVSALFPTLPGAEPPIAGEEAEEEGEAPEPSTILMDLLLALLRRQSAFVKTVAGAVLKGFADEVGAQAVEMLVDQVRVEEEEQAVEAEEEGGEDTEMADGEGKKEGRKVAAATTKDTAESDSDSDDDSSDDEGLEIDEAFKNELLAALEAGGMGVPNGVEGSDDESDEEADGEKAGGDEDEEEILDDDAMLALDERLADIFRANGGGRRSKKRDRTDDLHYRLRCLDLLDVLAHHKPSSTLLIATFVPLFNIVRTSTSVEHELQSKAAKLLRFLVQPRKAASSPSISPTVAAIEQSSEEITATALEALEDLHRAAASVDNADLAPLAAQVAVALVKASVSASPSSATEISRIALSSFEAYLLTKNSKTRCQPLLFLEVAKRVPAAVWETKDKVLELAVAEKVNAFRRMQAWEVVQALIVSLAALKTPESTSPVLAFLPSFRSALYTTISTSLASSATTGSLDAARLKLLSKNALTVARLTVQLSSQSSAADLWKPQDWATLCDPSKVSDRFKGAQGVTQLVKQLVGVLGGSVEAVAKPAGGKKDKKRKAAESVDAPSASASTFAQALTSTPNGKAKKVKGLTASTLASQPEEEVQDESIAGPEEDAEVGDVSIGVDEVVEGTLNGKQGKRKEKKKRRASEGKA